MEITRFYFIGYIVLDIHILDVVKVHFCIYIDQTNNFLFLFSEEKHLDEKGIHDRDMIWLNESDCKF